MCQAKYENTPVLETTKYGSVETETISQSSFFKSHFTHPALKLLIKSEYRTNHSIHHLTQPMIHKCATMTREHYNDIYIVRCLQALKGHPYPHLCSAISTVPSAPTKGSELVWRGLSIVGLLSIAEPAKMRQQKPLAFCLNCVAIRHMP